MKRTASLITVGNGRRVRVNTSSTASPSPPSRRWSSTTTNLPPVSWAACWSVSAHDTHRDAFVRPQTMPERPADELLPSTTGPRWHAAKQTTRAARAVVSSRKYFQRHRAGGRWKGAVQLSEVLAGETEVQGAGGLHGGI